jgi:ESCRT-I complex subunit TSG101
VTSKLLSLFGTLEITYKNKNYNIPICVWLPLNYPLSAPMIYVKPTPNMLIRTSKYVDNWKQDSSLLLFLRVLQQIFSVEPPVYSRPPNSGTSSSNSTPFTQSSGTNPSYPQASSSNPATANPSYIQLKSSSGNYANQPSKTPPGSQSHNNWRPTRQVPAPNPVVEEMNLLKAKLAEKIKQKSLSYFQMLDQLSQEQIGVNRKLIASQQEVDTSLKQLTLSCVIHLN